MKVLIDLVYVLSVMSQVIWCNVSIDISIYYYLGGNDDFSELLIKKKITSKHLKTCVREIMIG